MPGYENIGEYGHVMELWPPWMTTWYGLLIRFGLGGLGLLGGFTLAWIGIFATAFDEDTSTIGQPLVLILVGAVLIGTSLAAAFKPTKRTVLLWLASVLAVPILVGLI